MRFVVARTAGARRVNDIRSIATKHGDWRDAKKPTCDAGNLSAIAKQLIKK